jgi:prepilin-type N-terminal cleavage/methylation domain-containing protein
MKPDPSSPGVRRRQMRRGFSLVELLIVITVIGIMVAVAVPVLSPIRENARINKNQRNAQSLVAMASSAQAAGAVLDLSTVTTAVLQLKSGVSGTGMFSTSTFKVAPFSPEEIDAITEYISIADNSLVFTSR